MSSFQSDLDAAELRTRIDNALEYMVPGSFDGDHHKQWALDQILRALTGCPLVTKTKGDYSYEIQGESDEYKQWRQDWLGEWDEANEEYEYPEWDEGIAP